PRESRTILLDGFNLSLQRGTGIATYARNLSFRLKALGHRVDILYGSREFRSQDPLLREIMFYDPPNAEPLPRWRQALVDGRTVMRLLLRRQWAKEVPITGAVISEPFRNQMPQFDSLWNVPNIFE